MKALYKWLLMMVFVALPAVSSAQQPRTITGTVTEAETGDPLPSVRVTVKGTVIGTVTDTEGRFTLVVPGDANTLVFSAIGLRRRELPIQSEMSVTMERVALELEGIVVTALGIEREKPTLGYSVQDVTGEQVTEVPELNVVNSLQGQVAGVQITDAGPTAGSSRIVIRGASSIAGNNQPLFIVDGVPVDNSSPRNSGFGGIDYGNTIQDIDANNIANISVLKGPNAAALYGSRAANGAIVITTKSGANSPSVSISTSLMASNPLRLPNYQNLYGQGVNGEFDWVDGAGAGTWDFVDESWGPRMDGRLIDQFTGAQQPWVPNPDNIRNFFETGTQWQTNLAVAQASENANVRLSVTNTRVNGLMPGEELDRLSVAIKGGASISDRLYTEASLNYMNNAFDNRPGTGYDEDNPMQSFIWFGRQVDMAALRDYTCEGDEVTPCTVGGQFNWNYNYHNNPYWEQLVNTNTDSRNRLLGHVLASYRLGDWITVTGRVGRDWYRDHRKRNIAMNSLEGRRGGFGQAEIYRSETNADLIVAATRQLTADLGLNVTAVGNLRENTYQEATVAVSALTAPGIYTIDNAAITPSPGDYEEKKEVRSLRGSISLNYKGWWNLDLTGSNDWSSTLPEGENSFFYPAVSTAFLFSDAFNMSGAFLSSGKLRASWSRVGNDTDPYQLTSTFDAQQAWGGVPMFAVPNNLPNVDLVPEETQAWEIGTDLGFLNERLGFVLTYYDRTTENQILDVQISSTSGYTSQVLNAGKVRNYGTELLLRATPLRLDNGFRWDMTVNWAKNNSQVRELYGDLETLVLGDYWSLNVEARGPTRDADGNIVEYHPYGTLFGSGYLKDDQGRWLLDASGMPQVDPVRRVLGKYTPDWNGGIANRFSYGAFDLSVLFDGQMGGQIFSTTKWFGEYAGVLESTIRGRENDVCDPGIVVEGVLPDGSINGDGQNDVSVCPMDYFHENFGNNEAGIVDATYLKLRELRLGVEIPSSLVSLIGFDSGEFALIGRNLAVWSDAENIDPETAFDASNVQGLEFGQYPTQKSFGFSVTLRR